MMVNSASLIIYPFEFTSHKYGFSLAILFGVFVIAKSLWIKASAKCINVMMDGVSGYGARAIQQQFIFKLSA